MVFLVHLRRLISMIPTVDLHDPFDPLHELETSTSVALKGSNSLKKLKTTKNFRDENSIRSKSPALPTTVRRPVLLTVCRLEDGPRSRPADWAARFSSGR
jgi:hypothetical protein